MFFYFEKITSTWRKETPEMTTRLEFKKDAAREEWKKFNCSGLEKNRRRL